LETPLAVAGKTAQEIATRAETYRVLANIQMSQPDFIQTQVAFEPNCANLLSEAYFALSEAYKKRRLKTQSLTDWTKVAALTAVTVSFVRPIRPSGRVDSPHWPYLNPAFGLLCAYGLSQTVFEYPEFDQRRRFYQALEGISLPCLSPILAEGIATKGNFTSTWDLSQTISDSEIAYLDMLVTNVVEQIKHNKA
jgi:hypothetical protein